MRKFSIVLSFLIAASMLLTACGAPATTAAPATAKPATAAPATAAPAATQALTIPDIVQGKFNVAVVLIGFHADGGWSQAHTESAQWLTTQDSTINVAVLDTINPGPDAESAMRSLARKGFDLIIGTTFEYGPTTGCMSRAITIMAPTMATCSAPWSR